MRADILKVSVLALALGINSASAQVFEGCPTTGIGSDGVMSTFATRIKDVCVDTQGDVTLIRDRAVAQGFSRNLVLSGDGVEVFERPMAYRNQIIVATLQVQDGEREGSQFVNCALQLNLGFENFIAAMMNGLNCPMGVGDKTTHQFHLIDTELALSVMLAPGYFTSELLPGQVNESGTLVFNFNS